LRKKPSGVPLTLDVFVEKKRGDQEAARNKGGHEWGAARGSPNRVSSGVEEKTDVGGGGATEGKTWEGDRGKARIQGEEKVTWVCLK